MEPPVRRLGRLAPLVRVDAATPIRPLVVSVVGLVVLFLLVGLVLRPSGLGETLDGRTLDAVEPLRHGDTGIGSWWWFTQLGTPASYALFCLALVLVAAFRRRWRWLLLVPVTMLLSELSAQALKHLLAQPRTVVTSAADIGDAAWPSGHSTAAMTVALLAILVAPRRMRPAVAAIGVIGSVGVGVGMVIGGFHYPTDILGGYLCAAIWVVLAAIAMLAWERWRPIMRPVDHRPVRPVHVVAPLLLLGLGLLTAAAKAGSGDGGLIGLVRDHTAAVAVLGAIVVLAMTLVAAAVGLTGRRVAPPDGPPSP